MKNALVDVYSGLKSLFIGMRITIGQFFKPIITVQYPHETLKIPPRFRGHIELVRDPETGKPKCFVCKLCEKACPSDCITVEGVKHEGARRKAVTQYRLDFTKCSLCGSCVEACHDGAIRFSRDYNLAGLSKDEFVMDLFKRLEAEGHVSPATSAPPSAPVAPTLASPSPVAVTADAANTTAQSHAASTPAPAVAEPKVEVK